MAETRKLVRDIMQKDWGWGEVFHPEKAKELILQVTISFWFYPSNFNKDFLCISSFLISIFVLFSVFSGFT